MTPEHALTRLRDTNHPAVTSLARLVVDDALNTPIQDLVQPQWLATQLAAGLKAATRNEALRERAEQAFSQAMSRWGDGDEPLDDHVPAEVRAPLQKALSHTYVPSEAVVWRILDQPMFRSLMAEVLENSITGFRSRVSGVDDKLLGGLGRRAAKRGRGLFGGMADSVVGAVAGEVEHQFDKRLNDFLSMATGEALRGVARHAANPDNAAAYATMRVGVFESVLSAPVRELASEIEGAQPMAYVDVFLEGLRGALGSPSFVSETAERLQALMDEVGDGTFGAWLDDVGLREVWSASTVELLDTRLRATVQTDAFAGWWVGLFTETAPG